MQKIRKIAPGSTIGIVATGSPLSEDRFLAGVRVLEEKGYTVRVPLSPSRDYGSSRHGFANGSAAERLAAFTGLLRDREVSVILSARGGYGSLDLLPSLDWDEVKRSETCVVGLSDVTALLVPWAFQCGVCAIHGTSLGASFADYHAAESAAQSVDALLRMLGDPSYLPTYRCRELRAGRAEGPILAGNLTMLVSLLGTPWDVSYDGAVLVIEDVGDAPYRIHRALTQLKLAGKLDNLSALVFGRFSRCEAKHGPTIADVLSMVVDDMVSNSTYPILSELESGHWGTNLPLPLGLRASVGDGALSVLETPVY